MFNITVLPVVSRHFCKIPGYFSPDKQIVQTKIPIFKNCIHKDIFACLFSIHNIISLSCHEQVCLSGLVHDMMNLLYYFKNCFCNKFALE